MKKFALLVAAVLASSAFFAAAPANAAGPYPGPVKTSCHLAHMKKKSHHRRVHPRVWVTASGNTKVRGSITVRIGHRSETVTYDGGAPTVHLGKFHKGHHTIKMHFTPKSGSVFKGCSVSGTIKLT